MQSQAVRRLVHLVKILPDRVDHEADDVRVLVHEEREGEVALRCRAEKKSVGEVEGAEGGGEKGERSASQSTWCWR